MRVDGMHRVKQAFLIIRQLNHGQAHGFACLFLVFPEREDDSVCFGGLSEQDV